MCANVRGVMWLGFGCEEEESEKELMCEPTGHGEIATESVLSRSPF